MHLTAFFKLYKIYIYASFTYFCTAQTSEFQQNASNFFAISEMIFSKIICLSLHFAIFILSLMKLCRNFANVLRKWKTIWRFAEFVANNCGNSLKFPRPNELFIITTCSKFCFSIHSCLSASGRGGFPEKPRPPLSAAAARPLRRCSAGARPGGAADA